MRVKNYSDLCFRVNYGYDVDVPSQKQIEEPQRYVFDYKLETPVAKPEPSNLEGLVTRVDRIVMQKPGNIQK